MSEECRQEEGVISQYFAPAPDCFPLALQAALYKADPWTMKDFLTAFDYLYWEKIWKPRATKEIRQFVDHLGRLLEATTVTFVAFADVSTEVLVPRGFGDAVPPMLDVPARDIALAAMRQGLPQCVTAPDGAECIAIPCYAYTTCDRPDLATAESPGLAATVEIWQRALACEDGGPGNEPPPAEPQQPPLLGALVAWRPRGAEPLAKLAWQRALYCAAYTGAAIAALVAADRLPLLYPRTVTPRPADAPTTWERAIPRWFTRATVAEQLAERRALGPDEWSRFLRRAYTQLGFGHPQRLHPKRLYEQLAAHQNAASLIAMTEATRQSATAMSMTAISEEWLGTLRNVMGGMTQVIPDAPTVLFVAAKGPGQFVIEHTLDATLTPDQEQALLSVTLWTAIQGEAIHDAPTDDRMLFQHLRAVLEMTAPIVAIPVYNWRATGQRERPDLHGVFIGIRYPDAPPPVAATWCAWVLAAQYLLSPLAAAVEAKKAPYTPTDVEQSLETGHRHPFDPPSGKEQGLDDLREAQERPLRRPIIA